MDSTARATRHTWVPWVAALAGAAYTLKVALIVASGNEIADGPVGVLYLGGLVLGLVAAAGAGMRRTGLWKGFGVGLGSAVLLVLWIMGLGEVLEPVVGVVTDTTYVQEETPILVAGLVLLALAWRARARDLRDEVLEPVS